MSASATKFDMKRNPAYQIDWATASSGKRVAATKRRVRFRFGFSSRTALANGMTGNEARGEEHEVGIIWSLTSGKRAVTMDGQEVHHSIGRRGDAKFETSWPFQGGHILKIVAHATPPLRATPGFKQYDLLLDGISFFDLPRIFEVGVQRARAVEPLAHDHGFAYNSRYQEEERRRVAPSIRHEEIRTSGYPSPEPVSQGMSGPVRRATMETIPMGAAPAPSVAPQDVLSELARTSDFLESQSTATRAVDEFTPVQVQAQPPTFQDVSNQILSAYGPAPTAPAPVALANNPHTHYTQPVHTPIQKQQPYLTNAPYAQQQQLYPPAMVSPDASAAASGGFYAQQESAATPQMVVETGAPDLVAAPVVTPTMMKPLELDELRDSPPPINPFDLAVQNLVNLNDIKETRTTPEQIKAKKQKELTKAQERKSRPKAPAATDWHVGTNASLADIQKHKKPVAPPSKEVMKIHAFDPAAAQAGMLVVYGSQQQQPQQVGGYAGSIPSSTGFGAGRVYHHGYNQPLRSAF